MGLLKTPSALPNLCLRLLHYIVDRMLKIILRTILSALKSQVLKAVSWVGVLVHRFHPTVARLATPLQ